MENLNTKDEKIWTVYIHTIPKEITGYEHNKHYVGITSRKPEIRWANGNGYNPSGHYVSYFYNAIKKYGWENIIHKILYTNLTQYEANNLEQLLIKALKSNQKDYGYNIQNGGQAGKMSQEIKDKISKAHIGIKMQEEVKKYLSDSRKGMKLSKEWIENRTKSQTGLKRSKETCKKIGEGQKIPIICLNTRIVFNSMTDIQLQTGINMSHISQCCNKQRRTAGKDADGNSLFWMWHNEYLSINGEGLSFEKLLLHCKPECKSGKFGRKVRCVNTSIIYDNAQHASDVTLVKRSNISKCCNGLRKSAGKDENGNRLFWEYVD